MSSILDPSVDFSIRRQFDEGRHDEFEYFRADRYSMAVAAAPVAVFVTMETGPSWLVFSDPDTGTRIDLVEAPIWNERIHMLETSVVDETALRFEDLETRIAAELAYQQAKFDDIALPPLPPARTESVRPRFLLRFNGRRHRPRLNSTAGHE